ncbi:metal ABC transporter substrate-binding protein [Candidatus Magnetominusculus dajiuhuensis]|uniref:metal ABC transporter substrate-binding protein n=1 Tax=Candidatus Magnetominusculus dajiuhuensis TaxID=3137712 RepID=UPI003B4322B4
MKGQMKTMILCAVFLAVFSGSAYAKLNIVATLPWIGSITRQIAGNNADITTLAKPNQDPHYLAAKPSMILAARKADLIIYNGLDLEIGYLPVILESSRNPKLQTGKPGNLDCSGFVLPIGKVDSPDRSMGDVHPLGNPHYHYSPKNIIKVAGGITERLSQIDPANETTYRANLESFKKKFNEKMKEWTSGQLQNKKFIFYHALYDYICADFNCTIAGYVEDKPGIPPSSKGIERLIEAMKREKPDKIVSSAIYPQKEVPFIADKTGVAWVNIPSDIEDGQDWFSFMDKVISLIK